MNRSREDEGVLADFTFDLAFGKDENNFECVVDTESHCCEEGYFLYYEGTEYGGIIDKIKVSTDKAEITYIGRTWHGLLESKVIEPLKATDASGGGAIVHKGGKNLIPYDWSKGTTYNGMIFTEKDSFIHAEGESEIDIWILLGVMTLPKGTYTFSANQTKNSFAFGIVKESNRSESLARVVTGSTTMILAEETEIRIRLYGAKNQVYDNDFTVMLEYGNKGTSYQPYKSLEKEYLMLSGEANSVIGWLIERMGLGALFTASTEDSGIDISNYKMNRYIGGYEGIRKMLKDAGAKLHIEFKEGFAELSARPLVDYSKDEEFDTDQIDFVIEKNFHPINHVICLGAGNLSEREVIHVYADVSGNISTTQSIFGVDEVTAKYDNPNAESSEALMQGGIDLLKASWNADKVDFDFNSNEKTYDIGDVVGAREFVTGISASSEIVKKIVKIKDNTTTISYEVGEV